MKSREEETQVRVVVVDDEPLARQTLTSSLRMVDDQFNVIAECCGVDEAVQAISRLKPDVVFLDVEMLDGTGFQVLERLSNRAFQVVFITAFDHYAVKAFREHAVDYLLKPIDLNHLREAVSAIRGRLRAGFEPDIAALIQQTPIADRKRLALRSNGRVDLVDPSTIHFCKASGAYSVIHLKDGRKITTCMLLKDLHAALGEREFVRIDNATVVSIHAVASYVRARENSSRLF